MENSSKIFFEVPINKSFYKGSCHIPSETEKVLRQELTFWLGTQWAKNENILQQMRDFSTTYNSIFNSFCNFSSLLISVKILFEKKFQKHFIYIAHFWMLAHYVLDGIAKTLVALVGVFLNVLAAYILNRPKMKNSFNLCLVVLNVIDTIFLVGGILESFKR